MPKSGLTSTQEGYGWTHQQARRRLIAALRDGDPCCRCQRPMYRWQATLGGRHRLGLDADHYQSRKPAAPDALAHRSCNRSAGATYGNRLRGARRHGRAPAPAAWRAELPRW